MKSFSVFGVLIDGFVLYIHFSVLNKAQLSMLYLGRLHSGIFTDIFCVAFRSE